MKNIEKLCCEIEKYLTYDIVSTEWGISYQDIIYLILRSYDHFINNKYELSLMDTQVVLDRTWELLNTGPWCNVPFKTRQVYASASLIKVCCILRLGDSKDVIRVLSDALSATDDGLLLGAGLYPQLTSIASTLSDALHQECLEENSSLLKEQSLGFEDSPADWELPGIKGEVVPTLKCPSLEAFSLSHFNPKLPVKLTGCIDHWPALTKWKDIGYLLKVGGGRKVPIEIGSQYTESDWGMKLYTLREFITRHILNKQPTIGYLAQHQLFNQVAELHDDIRVPEYCCLSESDEESGVDINTWFGPKGTVSPLHHDPKHNLLTQVIGRKRIIMFSPENSSSLYPLEGDIMSNTSSVDPENPDYNKFPHLAETIAYECHLYPGEMLYIPPKWWHHVRALDISFSVSFWWL